MTPMPQLAIDYCAAPAPNSRARRAVIYSLLPVPFLGVKTIHHARLAKQFSQLNFGRGRWYARAALCLGVLNILVSLVALVAAPMAAVQYHHARQRARAVANVRLIADALMFYANDNNGWALFQPNPAAPRRLKQYLSAANLKSPLTGTSYQYAWLSREQLERLGAGEMWNYAEIPILWDRPNGHGAAVLFLDFHVDWLDDQAARKVVADRLSGHIRGPWRLSEEDQRFLATQPSR